MAFDTLHAAIKAIAARTGLHDLAPNADGVFELVVADRLPVFFQIVGDAELEVQVRLPDLEARLNTALVGALLRANLEARFGRFSLEPGTNRVVFGGRIAVVSHDEAGLMRRIDAIIREGAHWNGSGADRLDELARGDTPAGLPDETFLRV